MRHSINGAAVARARAAIERGSSQRSGVLSVAAASDVCAHYASRGAIADHQSSKFLCDSYSIRLGLWSLSVNVIALALSKCLKRANARRPLSGIGGEGSYKLGDWRYIGGWYGRVTSEDMDASTQAQSSGENAWKNVSKNSSTYPVGIKHQTIGNIRDAGSMRTGINRAYR